MAQGKEFALRHRAVEHLHTTGFGGFSPRLLLATLVG